MLIKVYLEDNSIIKVDSEIKSMYIPYNRNINGVKIHRKDGYAMYNEYEKREICVFNGWHIFDSVFALKTNHLVCKNCFSFCKQSCFLE